MHPAVAVWRLKPIMYLATSRRGRDWSTEHVNDIRRLPGGWVFDGAEFGSAAAKVPAEERVAAAQGLMHEVFRHAEERGIDVNFALDFDLLSSNPQETIRLLPEADRFRVFYKGVPWMGERGGKVWLARPDTPGGYPYYKAQVDALLDAYPQVDTVTLWRRFSGSVWVQLRLEDLPSAWQEEYRKYIVRKPAAAKLPQSVGAFAQAKLLAVWRRALDEAGRQDVQLAVGSWRFPWVPAAAEFLPKNVKIVVLDSEVVRSDKNLRNENLMRRIDDAVADGRLIPVIWAHHDDGEYIGAPLDPFLNFQEQLQTWGAGGFGIIHWTTRPLDVYFLYHGRNAWSRTANETPEATCRWAAERYFGPTDADVTARYLRRWWNEMPHFGRETIDRFIERPLTKYKNVENVENVVAGCRDRMKLLEGVDRRRMTSVQQERLEYYVQYEQFVADFFETHGRYEQAKGLLRAGEIEHAARLLADCNPDRVLERYAKLIQLAGPTRGEQGVLFSMGLRWWPYYYCARQQAGIEAIRINLGPTQHEPLAQLPGRRTYFIDKDRRLWQTRGQQEMRADVFVFPGQPPTDSESDSSKIDEGIARSGLLLNKTVTLSLSPILTNKASLPAGRYALSVLATGNGAFELSILLDTSKRAKANAAGDTSEGAPIKRRITIHHHLDGSPRLVRVEKALTLSRPGRVKITLVPIEGNVVITGIVLQPVSPQAGTFGEPRHHLRRGNLYADCCRRDESHARIVETS